MRVRIGEKSQICMRTWSAAIVDVTRCSVSVVSFAVSVVASTTAGCSWAGENLASGKQVVAVTRSKPDPKELVGKESLTGEALNGWVYRGGGGLYRERFSYTLLSNQDVHALALTELVSRKEIGGVKRPVVRFRDAVVIKGRPQNKHAWYDLVSDCRSANIPTEMDLRLNEQFVFAEVNFKKCERYSTNILGAWLIDVRRGVIEPIEPKGMVCGNTFLDSGLFTECKFIPRAW